MLSWPSNYCVPALSTIIPSLLNMSTTPLSEIPLKSSDETPMDDSLEDPLTPLDIPPLPSLPTLPALQRARSLSTARQSPVPGFNPLLPTSSRTRTPLNATTTQFSPLALTSSRRSQLSTRTFVDSASLVTVIPQLERETTRISRIGKGYHAEVIHEHHAADEDGEEKEEIVAVQVTPDGHEFTFPDGGRDVSLQ